MEAQSNYRDLSQSLWQQENRSHTVGWGHTDPKMPLKLPSQCQGASEALCNLEFRKQEGYGNTYSLWWSMRECAVVSTAELYACCSVWHWALSMMDDLGQLESQSVLSCQRIMSTGLRQEWNELWPEAPDETWRKIEDKIWLRKEYFQNFAEFISFLFQTDMEKDRILAITSLWNCTRN